MLRFLKLTQLCACLHPSCTPQDVVYAIRQAAAAERLVQAGRLPPHVRGVLAALANEFYGRHRERLYVTFRQLDTGRTG